MNIYCYPHYINDWKKDTAHLSLEQRGVYRELLDALYACGGKIPADLRQVGRMIGVQTASERKSLVFVIETFLTKDGDFLLQKRVASELEKIKTRSQKASQSARAKTSKNKDIISANAERTERRTLSERLASHQPIAKCSQPASPVPKTAREAGQAADEMHGEEVLPSHWQDYAEAKNIPNQQIFKSWRKFKDVSAFPYQLSRWKAWVDRERVGRASP